MEATWMEQIEAYLNGQLSRAALEAYARTHHISDVEADINWVRDAQTAAELSGLRQQLKLLLPLPTEKPVAQIKRLPPIPRIMAIAAGILLLVFFYAVYTQLDREPNLFAEFNYVDPGLPIQMSQSPNYRLLNALTYYSEGNYEETIRQLRQLYPERPQNDTLNYYLGASLLYEGQPEEARTYFSTVRNTDNLRFAQRADWLYALSFLAEKNYPAVRQSLKPLLEQPDHPFFERAQALANAIP